MREGAIWPEPGSGVPARLPVEARCAPDPDAPRHEAHGPEVVDAVASTADLARIAADQCPDASAEAADWFLGPWADLALDRHVLLAVLAHHGLTERDGATSAERHVRDPGPNRAGIRAAARAPFAAFHASDGRLEDRTGLAPAWRPSGLVAAPDGFVLGRAVPTRAGWVLVAPIPVPTLPELDPIVERALAVARTRNPRATVESALARFGPLLSRAVHDHAWSHA